MSGDLLSVHRLVQDVVRDGMEQETRRLWAERAVSAVNRVIGCSPFQVTYKMPEECSFDGLSKVMVSVTEREGGPIYSDLGVNNDIIVAFTEGYVSAVNTMLATSSK